MHVYLWFSENIGHNCRSRESMRFLYLHVQWKGRAAVMQASGGGHLGVVKELVGAQADLNEQEKVCSLLSNIRYAY